MPGPRIGPRPEDFDEELVRKSPTFQKWMNLQPGQSLCYACRHFVKCGDDDEERLMRRIMIARRNNLKDHATLKQARAAEAQKRGLDPGQLGKKGGKSRKPADDVEVRMEEYGEEEDGMDAVGAGACPPSPSKCPPSPSNPSGTKRRRSSGMLGLSHEQILMEMDVPAVESTRSYRRWRSLPEGTSFTYNQTYVRGQDDHDWLLRKNIWRRMRYRRENSVKVAELKNAAWFPWRGEIPNDDTIQDEADFPEEEEEDEALVSKAVVDAAAAALAQVEAFEPGIDADAVAALGANDPIVSSALDAAAYLAAAAVADASADEEDLIHV